MHGTLPTQSRSAGTNPHRRKLTDALVQRLRSAEGAPYRVADADQPALFLIVGKRYRSFTAQADLRRNGRRVRTLKRVLGRAPEMSVRTARAAAREFLGAVARGEDPRTTKRMPANLTLRETWPLYENEHLRRLRRSETTIANYRFHVERHLADLGATPLADLSRDPRRVAEVHARITEAAGPAQANAVMRTLRILYRFARRQAPGQLPVECPTAATTLHPEKRRNTALALDDLPSWYCQLQKLNNPIRREFHLLTLLSGSRPGALKAARWQHVDVKARVLHVPRPKGGEARSFDIPVSRSMMRALWRVRNTGRGMYADGAKDWIFPAESRTGHLTEHKEDRKTLGRWGGDLRQTYRTVAQAIGISELDVRLLLNHRVSDVSAEYITRDILVRTSLRDAQDRLSSTLMQALRA